MQFSANLLLFIFIDIYHLNDSEVFFPPDKLGIVWSQSGHHVVEVHNDVNESVKHPKENGVTSGCETVNLAPNQTLIGMIP